MFCLLIKGSIASKTDQRLKWTMDRPATILMPVQLGRKKCGDVSMSLLPTCFVTSLTLSRGLFWLSLCLASWTFAGDWWFSWKGHWGGTISFNCVSCPAPLPAAWIFTQWAVNDIYLSSLPMLAGPGSLVRWTFLLIVRFSDVLTLLFTWWWRAKMTLQAKKLQLWTCQCTVQAKDTHKGLKQPAGKVGAVNPLFLPSWFWAV